MFLLLAEGCGLQMIKFVLLGHHSICLSDNLYLVHCYFFTLKVSEKMSKMQLFKQT